MPVSHMVARSTHDVKRESEKEEGSSLGGFARYVKGMEEEGRQKEARGKAGPF